jgi:glucan phosphoethanolaminetransferase (alkaline phosphatase superfamily)
MRMPVSRATLVLVIGESINRQRMILYGYPRETTPELTCTTAGVRHRRRRGLTRLRPCSRH